MDCGRFGNIIIMFDLSGGGAVGEVRNGKKVMEKESMVGEMVVGSPNPKVTKEINHISLILKMFLR